MRIFEINKNAEFKQTVAVLDNFQLHGLLKEAIAEKLGIDLQDEKNSCFYTNTAKIEHLITGEYDSVALAIHFIEKV